MSCPPAMRRRAQVTLAALLLGCTGAPGEGAAPARLAPTPAAQLIDGFESVDHWRAIPAEGVRLALHAHAGVDGRSMRLDVDVSRGGYAIARRELDLPLPKNYEIAFWLRGEMPPNTLEFKLVDVSGENVWWYVQRDLEWPREWQRMRIRKRQISFAWGPRGGGDLERAAALEIAITAGAGGGRGSIWIDSLSITPLEPVEPYDVVPVATASSAAPASPPSAVLDADSSTMWRSTGPGPSWIALDFRRMREYGGLTLHWDSQQRPDTYDVEVSSDGRIWETRHTVRHGAGARDWIPLPETESRWLRISVSGGGGPLALRSLSVHPLDWAATPNDFLHSVAREAPRGAWPRYLRHEQLYWTILGPPDGRDEALLSEDGALEPRRAGPMLEPFLRVGDRLIGWSDVQAQQTLVDSALPIPIVSWPLGDLELEILPVADTGGAASVHARYRVHNRASSERPVTLVLALRPVQVNPAWQFLGTPGGAARVREIRIDDATLVVNGETFARFAERPSASGALAFHAGNIVERLGEGRPPAARQIHDALGYGSAFVAFDLSIPPGAHRDVHALLPMSTEAAVQGGGVVTPQSFEQRLEAVANRWRRELGAV